MDEQKELFEFEKPKKPLFRIARILSFPKAGLGITVPVERAIFIIIGVILALVIVYALGVEKGKAMGTRVAIATQPKGLKAVPAARPVAQAPVAMNPYTIIAATFSNRVSAQEEINRLKRNGFDAYLVETNSHFQARVGSYPTRANAQAVLDRVRKTYKDAYLKLR